MARVNPSGRSDKPNNNRKKTEKKFSTELVQITSNQRTHRNKNNQSVGELFKLLGEASIVFPAIVILGAGKLIKNYLLEYKELGIGISEAVRDAIKHTKVGVSNLKAKFTKPQQIGMPEVISHLNIETSENIGNKDDKTTSGSNNSSGNSLSNSEVIPTVAKDKRKRVVGEPILSTSLLEQDDRELIIKLSEAISTSINHKTEKVLVFLESLLMGVSFNDYIGVFNSAYKNHLKQEELLEVAKSELTGIIGSSIHDYDLASKIVERLSNLNFVTIDNEFQDSEVVSLKFPTKATFLAEEFIDIPGIQQFLGLNTKENFSSEEIDLREDFLRDLIDISPASAKINLNSEYKHYLEFKSLKDSRKYGFALGRIDEILRKGTIPQFKNFAIRKKLAQILASSTNENQEIIDFTSKVVEMANCGITGVERFVDKVHENRYQSISGHAVEAKNICNLFNAMSINKNIKLFNIEASKNIRSCDVDAYVETIDFADAKRVFFVEIKSSPDYAGKNIDQRDRLLVNLPQGGKLIYIIDNLSEKFVEKIINYNEVAKLKEIASNEKIEIWQNNGVDLTSKIRNVLGIRDFSISAA